ncbi:MAG: hypothetical protein U9R75_07870 [Candidatus Thermoplasmatota archaeon]|nr:hypothetical protein [Candidatus Thermoplasmatota archaeon]
MRKKISLTVDERVVLHLMNLTPNEEDFEAPDGATQAGIARNVGIERKHVPRAVKKLIAEELITTKVSHVKGGRQRKKVYFLTFEGKALSRKIWDNIAKKRVLIRDENGDDNETTFSELCFTYQVGKSPVELLMGLDPGNVFNPHKIEIRKQKPNLTNMGAEGGQQAMDIYRNALKVAWEDSVLTKEEAAILKDLRGSLGISQQDHIDLQEEILDSGLSTMKELNKKDIYRKIMEVALRDGEITTDEQDILDELERVLGLDDNITTNIKMEMKLLEGEHVMTESRRKENYKDIYGSVIMESMKDGKISRDEQNIIVLLKKLLHIDDKDHLELFGRAGNDDS